jgi:DNA polymerase-3 subunit epsilon
MTWADGVLAAFDIETTGLSPESDEIVQVAVISVDRDGRLLPDSWTTIVNPGRPIPPEVVAVHGITSERAERDGIPAEEAARQTLDRLAALAARDVPVVIYNAPFDLGFMQVRAGRLGTTLPELLVIDPLVCDRHADKYRRGSRKLEAVARHYGCAAEGLHDAEHDSAVSVAVARAIARQYPEIGASSLADLHRQQTAWYADWAVDFAAYQRRAGRDGDSVDEGWPVPRRLSSQRFEPAGQATEHAAPHPTESRPWWRLW